MRGGLIQPQSRGRARRSRSRRLLLVAAGFALVVGGAAAIGLGAHGLGWALVLGGVSLASAAVQA
jgi:hypothetical protein